MIAVSPTAKSAAVPAIAARCQGRARSVGKIKATDHASSHPVSANAAGLRNDTGPVTGPPPTSSAPTCTTSVPSSTQPTSHSARLQPVVAAGPAEVCPAAGGITSTPAMAPPSDVAPPVR